MYAIRNKKTGLWVYGTDYRYWPRHQNTSAEQALTFDELWFAESEFKHRGCSERLYEIVPVKLIPANPREGR